MSQVDLTLSSTELKVFAGACATYMGVPFHRVEKLRIAADELDRIQQLFNQFIHAREAMRDNFQASSTQPNSKAPVALRDDELELLIEVFETVLKEHEPPGAHADSDLELHIGPRPEVEAALARLRRLRQQAQTV